MMYNVILAINAIESIGLSKDYLKEDQIGLLNVANNLYDLEQKVKEHSSSVDGIVVDMEFCKENSIAQLIKGMQSLERTIPIILCQTKDSCNVSLDFDNKKGDDLSMNIIVLSATKEQRSNLWPLIVKELDSFSKEQVRIVNC